MSGDKQLAATMIESLRLWDAMKADGVEVEERRVMLEKTLRQAWPFTREWKYLCQRCCDFGLEMHECPGDATCGRQNPHRWHEYGTPCWCGAGEKFKKPQRQLDDFTEAGKTPKRGGFSRVGR